MLKGGAKKIWRLLALPKLTLLLLGLITIFCVIGTLIPQNAPPVFYLDRYGSLRAAVMHKLGLVNIFGTLIFRLLLFLLAVNLVCCTARRGMRHWSNLGAACLHLGIVVILLGALIHSHWHVSGNMQLSEGESSSKFVRADDPRTEGTLPINLKLLDFFVDRERAKPVLVVHDLGPVPTLTFVEGALRDICSRVEVIGKEGTLGTADIRVNHPLHYQEWTVYQWDYNRDIPGTTILMVSRDRGMWVIYAGFGMLLAGVWFTAYVAPFRRQDSQ